MERFRYLNKAASPILNVFSFRCSDRHGSPADPALYLPVCCGHQNLIHFVCMAICISLRMSENFKIHGWKGQMIEESRRLLV